ncbi:hypothetical protein [Methylobacterium sp. WL6]|uniref:hypothetical protein n=1 Tax=Methylobacterium sp. WL6 TaxID=2603901 RepID=UPI0011C9722D|nr:hypothetical protein [Methylobacterium sp. WL6]TXN73423.1 hypothetical protein FV230_01240 [Methylobacterium sp. WL6]
MTIQLSRQQRRTMQRLANEADKAIEGDRRFFVRHPSREYRVRLISKAEQRQTELIEGGTFNLTAATPAAFIALKQVAPGVRLKVVVFGPAEAIGEELCEADARDVFEGYADKHPQIRKQERMMRLAMAQLGSPYSGGGKP